MKPSDAFKLHRQDIARLAHARGARNLRVFGSVAKGADTDTSDVDLLVDVVPGTTLLDLGALNEELTDLLGVPVDLRTPADLPPKFRAEVLRQAIPL